MRQCTVRGDDKTKFDTTAMRFPYLQTFTKFENSERKSFFYIYIQVMKINDKEYITATLS